MLAIWNRRELVTVLTMQEQSDILSALRDAGLDYAVKVIDRSSPSALISRFATQHIQLRVLDKKSTVPHLDGVEYLLVKIAVHLV